MQAPFFRFILVLTASAMLCACGFQLRGSGGSATILPEDWKQMHLVTGNPNSEFSREILTRFEVNGVQWTDQKSANYILYLGRERFQQRNLSLNSEARAAEFELTMSSRFSVKHQDRTEAMEETVASVIKQMENDPRNATGKSEEIRLLKQEMRAELAQQIMRRIGFFAASAQADGQSG